MRVPLAIALGMVAVLAPPGAPALAQPPRANPLRSSPGVTVAGTDLAAERDQLCSRAIELATAKKWDAAIDAATQALVIQRAHLGGQEPQAFGILESIAAWQDRAGQYAKAAKTWSELKRLSTIVYGAAHWSAIMAGRFEEACSQAARLEARDQQLLASASELSFQADQQFAAAKYAGARDLAQQAFDIRRKLLGEENAITLTSSFKLGTALLALGECDHARPLLETCAATREKLFGLDNPSTLASLTSLSALYLRLNETAQTRETLGRILNGNSHVYGPLHPITVGSLFQLGSFELDQDNLSDAETILKLVKLEQSKIYEGKHLELARTCQRLGMLYLKKKDLPAADENFRLALTLYEQLAGADHPDTARALVDLATCEKLARRRQEAIAHLRRAIEIFTAAMGPKAADTVDAKHLLAAALPEVGETAKAERLYREVLADNLELYGETDQRTGLVLYQMGVLYAGWNDLGSAESCLRRAVAVYRQTLGESHPDTAAVLSMLASVDGRFGRFEQAETQCRTALEISQKTLGKTNPQTVATTLALGNIYLLEEKLDDAEKVFRDIVSIEPNATDDDCYHQAIIREKLAIVALRKSHFAEAITDCREVLAVYDRLLPKWHPHRIEPLTISAIASLALKQPNEARPLVEEANRLARQELATAAVAQSQRQQMSLNLRLRDILDVQLSLPRQSMPLHELYRNVLLWKGAVQARQLLQRKSLNPADAPLAEQLQSTVTRLASLSLNVPDGSARKQWLRELDELKQRKESLEAELAARASGSLREELTQTITPEQLQSVLPEDAALVDVLEYVQFSGGHEEAHPDETRYVAFIVRADRPVRRVDLGPAISIDEAIDTCCDRCLFANDPTAAGELARLAQMIWEPLLPYLRGCRTVLYSPDGSLTRFPLAALPGRKPGSYLIEDCAIGIVPAPQVLPRMISDDELRQTAKSAPDMLVVGNIDYAAASENDPGAAQPNAGVETGGELLTFEPLKSAQEEIRRLKAEYAKRFATGKLQILQQQDATEAAFRREAPRHSLLFIATHGFYAPPNVTAALATPDLLAGLDSKHGGNHSGALCGLALAGANCPPRASGDDGILTAYEVSALDLRKVDLVVLSGCETALGETTPGEGAISMQRAFQTAGARATVASLWSVPDEATMELMQRFLANLWDRQMPPLESLREAQISVLRRESTRSSTNAGAGPRNRLPPYYWAAFTLAGAWR